MKNIYYKTPIFIITIALLFGLNQVSVAQSVLEEGQLYKIQIEQNGLYQLNYDDFVNMGFDMENINPDHIQIFGNIEGVLPEANNKYAPTSLIENPIYLQGDEDGSFDTDDYVVFYGKGADYWEFNRVSQSFRFSSHPYADYNYYYVKIGSENGKRISIENSLDESPFGTVNSFLDYQVHEIDLVNFVKSGRRWFGESFDDYNSTLNLSFEFPNIILSEKISYGIYVAGRSRAYSEITTSLNNEIPKELSIPKLTGSGGYVYAKDTFDRDFFNTSTDLLDFKLTYSKPDASSNAWLDYFEVSVSRELKMHEHQMAFNHDVGLNINKVYQFQLAQASDKIRIWNISDPYNISEIVGGNLNDNTLDFSIIIDKTLYFIAFDSEGFFKPTLIGEVENQNLKQLTGFDMVIVTVDQFLSEAQRLADFHTSRDSMIVLITTVDEIYNEFSSGKQDPAAIRNFIRYHYNHAETEEEKPEYLLLFGDASYDYKDILPENTNLVPVFQSKGSLSSTSTFDTDDFYGIMNDADGDSSSGEIQISIGRFPVFTMEQAQTMVDKTLHYSINNETHMGNWRNKVCFIADDGDNNLHLNSSDKLADTFLIEHPEFNVGKIYLDSYVREITANGYRYPDVTEAINRNIDEGTLFLNYTGHGGHLALTDERVMQIPDILSWRNIDKLSVFIVASCEFGPFDDPHHISAGEHVVLNPLGGGVALLTTTRLAYASYNFKLNKKFHEIAFSRKESGAHYNLGEIIKYAKNESGNKEKNLNFCLLGDPALKMAYPEFHVETTHINENRVSAGIQDTMKSRQTVSVKAKVTDIDHVTLSDFNGQVEVCVYGQASVYTTLANSTHSQKTDFTVIDMVIYKGQVNANKGELEFSFVVPEGINPLYGTGKISYYATKIDDEVTHNNYDANGGYLDFIIGGVDETIEKDITAPTIDVFMENYGFTNGDPTSTDPLLIVDFFDESGINNVQLGFGRDITAKLDIDPSFLLNNYYTNDADDFRKGKVEYDLSNLDFGNHKLTIKAWDMFNNSTEKSVDFIVLAPSSINIYNVQNNPNPFQELTLIEFEHNQENENTLDVNIHIYNIQGQSIYSFEAEVLVLGNSIEPIQLDMNDLNLNQSGLFAYIIEVKNKQGQTVQQKQKFIVVK